MEDKKPMISTGSMLNSSEGLLATGSLAALTSALTSASDWRVQLGCAIGIAVLGSVYVYSRAMAKKA